MTQFTIKRLREIMNSDTDFVTVIASLRYLMALPSDGVLDDEFWFPQIIEFYIPKSKGCFGVCCFFFLTTL